MLSEKNFWTKQKTITPPKSYMIGPYLKLKKCQNRVILESSQEFAKKSTFKS